jgi:hypothetical protein
MKVLNALLVDRLQRHPDGRVDLLGLFEDIHLPTLPTALDSISVFVDLGFDTDERGAGQSLTLELRDPDGQSIHQSVVKFTVPTFDQYPRETAQLDLALFKPTFRTHGPHSLEIRHDDKILRALALHILS